MSCSVCVERSSVRFLLQIVKEELLFLEVFAVLWAGENWGDSGLGTFWNV